MDIVSIFSLHSSVSKYCIETWLSMCLFRVDRVCPPSLGIPSVFLCVPAVLNICFFVRIDCRNGIDFFVSCRYRVEIDCRSFSITNRLRNRGPSISIKISRPSKWSPQSQHSSFHWGSTPEFWSSMDVDSRSMSISISISTGYYLPLCSES